ncbi:MAG TPA: hypothetical protein DHV63_08135 [Pseudomonas sp.]|nr:hypothetical protein [Pseudomonas sp.]
MNPSERGKENLETIKDRDDRNGERDDRASGASNGEAAGGDRNDVPGGTYNVPPGMADEVSENDALKHRKPQNPER